MKKKILIITGALGLLMSTMFVFLNTGGTVSEHHGSLYCIFDDGQGSCDCATSNAAGYCDCGPNLGNTYEGDACSQYGIGPNGEEVVTEGVVEYFLRPVSKIRSEK